MPSLSEHGSSKFIKLMYIGDSGTGKTGSLVSLVAAGYKLKILDMDNGLSSLSQFIRHECPDKLANVEYETRRNRYKSTAQGPKVLGQPKAFTDALALMTEWSDGTDPAEWGEDTIFVLDSLTAYGRAALEWARDMNPTAKDGRQWYFVAQKAIEDTLALLTGDDFHCNVIVISHINWRELQDGTTKGYPHAVGSALGPHIPKYFDSLLLAESSGSGKNVRRKIKTAPTNTIDLKNPAPFIIEDELPLETGLATIFTSLKGDSNG